MNALRKQLELAGVAKRGLAIHQIAYAIVNVMKQHVGLEHALSKSALFQKLFKTQYRDDNIVDYVKWDFTRRAMHYLRVRTTCFIACTFVKSSEEAQYYVINSPSDAEPYVERLNASMKKMRYMQQRAQKAGREHWGRSEWTLPDCWLVKLSHDVKTLGTKK